MIIERRIRYRDGFGHEVLNNGTWVSAATCYGDAAVAWKVMAALREAPRGVVESEVGVLVRVTIETFE